MREYESGSRSKSDRGDSSDSRNSSDSRECRDIETVVTKEMTVTVETAVIPVVVCEHIFQSWWQCMVQCGVSVYSVN